MPNTWCQFAPNKPSKYLKHPPELHRTSPHLLLTYAFLNKQFLQLHFPCLNYHLLGLAESLSYILIETPFASCKLKLLTENTLLCLCGLQFQTSAQGKGFSRSCSF